MSTARTVRDETFAVMRRLGMTRVFGNPGSTEIPFLTDFPADLEFVLGLHEGAVVGMASGYALATGRPAFVNLHTAPGLGNAVNAIVCARDNRIPLVVVVGQQDRRQLALSPFLTGRNLERLAGDYPVWSCVPTQAADVPGAIARAWHEASLHRGPAVLIVPMSDWEQPLDSDREGLATPDRILHAPLPDPAAVEELVRLVERSRSPVLAVGAGVDTPEGWAATVRLSERLACPVWQDTFSSRAGFPQDHANFAGHLPWRRSELRSLFSGHDLVIAAGTPAFRLYMYDPGRIVESGTSVAVVSDDRDEVLRSRCELALLASPAAACDMLARGVKQRSGTVETFRRPSAPSPPAHDEPLHAAHVVAALAERLPADVILVEEAPSTRGEILSRIPTRQPMGFVAVANGALGFGLPAAVGLRMGQSERPVVALLGDGSTTFAVQALWSAAHYGVGIVIVVIANGGYGAMDELARAQGMPGAWPSFPSLDLATVARGFGCEARRVTDYDALHEALAAVVDAGARSTPLLIEVPVQSAG